MESTDARVSSLYHEFSQGSKTAEVNLLKKDGDGYILNVNGHWRSRDHLKAVPSNIFGVTEGMHEEVRRLLSASRKEEIAGVYFRFAEAISRKPGKDELDAPPPNYGKAYELYKKALKLEIGHDLRDEIKFRLGRMMQLAENYGQAIGDYRQYLADFDPDWMGSVDSAHKPLLRPCQER